MTVTQYGYHDKLVNGYNEGELDGAITDTATSLTVVDGTGLPEDGFFRLLIDDEIIVCNRRSGATVYVAERGAEGTTAAAHSSGATVECVITAGALQSYLLRNNHACAAYTEEATFEDSHSWPAPMGRVLDSTNATLTASSFTWHNQGSSTLTDVDGGFVMTCIREADANLRGVTISAPSTPYQFIGRFRNWVAPSWPIYANTSHCGLWIRESTSGKLVTASVRPGNAAGMAMWNWTDWNTFYSIVGHNLKSHDAPHLWIKLIDDGTDHRAFFSLDGAHWSTYGTAWWNQGRTTFLSTNGGDQIGFYLTSADNYGGGAGNYGGNGPAGGQVSIDCFRVEAL